MNFERMFSELFHKKYKIRNISLLLISSSWKKNYMYHEFSEFTNDRKKIMRVLQEMFFSLYSSQEKYRKT